MDCLFPGKVPMAKVNWGAKTDYEFVNNYKVLQSVFAKLKVDRAIEVDKLIRARYQDNLEFMQWLKRFYDDNYSGVVEDYDAIERRNRGKGVSQYPPAAGGASAGASAPAARRPAAPRAGRTAPRATAKASSPVPAKENDRAMNKPAANPAATKKVESLNADLESANKYNDELSGQVQTLQAEVAELKLQADGFEKERDFYFDKLRDVEVLLQNYRGGDREIVREVLKVLYATEDDENGEAALAAAEAALAEADADEGHELEPAALAE